MRLLFPFSLLCFRVCWGLREDSMLLFPPLERQQLLSSRCLNGTVLRRHRIKDSSNYKCGSEQRALEWKMPASTIIKQNSHIYFSAEEEMNSVLERDGKFISIPRGEEREEVRSLNEEEICRSFKITSLLLPCTIKHNGDFITLAANCELTKEPCYKDNKTKS